MKNIAVLTIIFLFSLITSSCRKDSELTATMRGIVSDTNGEPIFRAMVSLEGLANSGLSTTTDRDGYFEFSGLAQGSYSVTILKEGYKTLMATLSLTHSQAAPIQYTLEKLPDVEDIAITPSQLDFGADTDTLYLTIESIIRSPLAWDVHIADDTWLRALPTSGTMTQSGEIKLTFVVDRSNLHADARQIIVFEMGEASLAIEVSCRVVQPIFPVEKPDEPNNNPDEERDPSDDITASYSGEPDLSFTRDSNPHITKPPIIDCQKWTMEMWIRLHAPGNIFWVKSTETREEPDGVSQSLTYSDGKLKYVFSRYENRFHYQTAPGLQAAKLADGQWHKLLIHSEYIEGAAPYISTEISLDSVSLGVLTERYNALSSPHFGMGTALYFGGRRPVNLFGDEEGAIFDIAELKIE